MDSVVLRSRAAIADCMADDDTNKKIRDTIKSAKEAVQDVIVNAQLEKLERTPGNTIREVRFLFSPLASSIHIVTR